MCLMPLKVRRRHQSSRIGVINGCEPLCTQCWELNPGPQQVSVLSHFVSPLSISRIGRGVKKKCKLVGKILNLNSGKPKLP